MDLSLLQSSTRLISKERGMGLMLLLSVGLHLTAVLFFDVFRPRLPKLPRPVYYMELTKRSPAVSHTTPPPSVVPERERTPRLAQTPRPSQTTNPPAPVVKAGPQLRREEPAPTAPRLPAAEMPRSELAFEKVGPRPQAPPRPRDEPLPRPAKIALARPDGDLPLTVPANNAGERFTDRAVAAAPTPSDSFSRLRNLEPDLPETAVASRRWREDSSTISPPTGRARTALPGGSMASELPVPPPAAASSATIPATASQSKPAERSFDFLDRVAPADLDRSQLVSLNRLRTCGDPEAEMKLRTRLATLLSRPATCRFGGVVFDIQQPESAWSIHVDIYNYEQRAFENRCAALALAIASCELARR